MNSAEFLDRVRAEHGLTSDYQVGKKLGMPLSSISGYRTGARQFDDAASIKIAAALGEQPLYVIASVNEQRAKCAEVRDVWHYLVEVGRSAKAATASIIVGVSLSVVLAGEKAMQIQCILCKVGRVTRKLAAAGGRLAEKALYPVAVLCVVVPLVSLAGCSTGPNQVRFQDPPSAVELAPGHSVPVYRVSKICPGNRMSRSYKRCKGIE